MSEPSRRPVDTPREWLRYAQESLDVAGREMQAEMPAFHTVCFLCQSAAEKYLKGFLISRGWPLEKTHDIVKLLELGSTHDPELDSLLADGDVLNQYIVGGRYPGDIAFEDIGRAEANEALQAARRIRERVLELTGRAA